MHSRSDIYAARLDSTYVRGYTSHHRHWHYHNWTRLKVAAATNETYPRSIQEVEEWTEQQLPSDRLAGPLVANNNDF